MRQGINGGLERVVTVEKSELLSVLAKNRSEHAIEYAEAVAGYTVKVRERLRSALNRAESQASCTKDLDISLNAPISYDKEFERAIRMFEMDVGDQVELSITDFNEYIMNQWNWQRSFVVSNAEYSSALSTKAARMF